MRNGIAGALVWFRKIRKLSLLQRYREAFLQEPNVLMEAVRNPVEPELSQCFVFIW